MKKLILALLLVVVPSTAFAHARWTNPVPRNDLDNIKDGNNLAPCGGARGTSRLYEPGQTITVEWEETITHPGYYQILWSSAGDANFVVMEDNIPNPDMIQANNTFQFTFPNEECTDCTLQLIQVMTNSMTNYYSCIDITLQAGGTPDAGGDAGTPDTGTPDTGTGTPDVGGTPDSGTGNNMPGNNQPGNNEPGNNQPGNNNTGGTSGTGGVDAKVNGEGGCSTTPSAPNLLPLLLIGLFGLRRRR